MSRGFDYIVIGAGSAGCVVAARLSQDHAVSVLLLEAGGSNDDDRITTPAKFGALANTRFDWGFRTSAQAELHGRQIYYPRGRTIGGTGSINYMINLRGHQSDYNHWSQLGCAGWSWDDVLPYFKRSEDNRIHSDSLHGTSGPIVVDEQPEKSPLTETFIRACVDAGIPFNPDLNGAEIEGCGYFPATLKNNERCSTAAAYLAPAGTRENLTVESGATITRIVLDGNRAVGVDYLQGGQVHHAHASVEIILCAGAIGSPQLLQLSGIGPSAVLKSAGVAVLHDLPGVGKNLQDHLHYRSRWEITEPLTLYGRSAEEMEDVQRRYDNDKSGPLTTNHYESGAFLNSRAGLDAPDIELLMIPFFVSLHAPELRPPDRHGFTISGFPTRPQSRGQVTITSDDPLDRPVIDPGYLTEPADLELMVEIVKRSRDIVASREFDQVRGCEISPGDHVQSHAGIVEEIRSISSTSFHPLGSCKMGSDEMAVVDPQLRVRGLSGLRVADASIMPEMNTGHPNAPTIMIAERAAEFLLSDA